MQTTASRAAPWRQILPLALLIYAAVLLPPEAQFEFAGANFPIYRIFILAMIPMIIGRLVSSEIHAGLVDWLLFLMSAWMIFSFVHAYGLGTGVVRGGGVVIDTAGAYLIARVSIDGTTALRRLLIVIAPGLMIAGLTMLLESILLRPIVRPAFAAVFGFATSYEGGQAAGAFDFSRSQDVRLGLLRASGPFPHPILGGIILTSMLPLWLKGGIRSWPRLAGIASAALGLFSISSAAFLALGLAIGLCTVDRFRRYFAKLGWPLITTGILLVLLALQLASKNGVVRVIARLTLDPQTAYYRIMTWTYGSRSIAEHPLYGIGFNVYKRAAGMTSSIDAHFLLLGVRNGLLVPALLLGALLLTMIRLGLRSSRIGGADGNLFVALNFTLVIVLVSALTVTLFGSSNIWFMALIGIAASLVSGRVTAQAPLAAMWRPIQPVASQAGLRAPVPR